ncbi:MAG TPA: 50S ribosomal protein L29 [Thermoplasmataceae archaeon]|nr:50S ribosomal protein L29 [Thermoplasmatales archaeon AK]HLH85999.1 50S ribosomal protein L29 [Thermoplasmataceae archaeon]
MEIRNRDLKQLSKDEVVGRLKSLEESLLRERASVAMGGAPINPGKIRSLRRQIARIKTFLGSEDNK